MDGTLARIYLPADVCMYVCVGCGGYVERRCSGSGSGVRSDRVHRTTRHSFHLLEVVRGHEEPSRSANLRRYNRHVCRRCTRHNQVRTS